MRADVAAIVPAAGTGRRLNVRQGKLYIPLRGEPLLAHTLRALQGSPAIRWIVLVVRAGEQASAATFLARHGITKALPPCTGGASRAESVHKGFAAVPRRAQWVLVHDAARPCVSPAVIARAVRVARRSGAVACGLRAALTVKAVDDRGDVRLTLDRDRLWLVQTPQVFRRAWFAEALGRVNGSLDQFPDDASIVEAAGFPVRMVEGDALNIKVTTRADVRLADAILRNRR